MLLLLPRRTKNVPTTDLKAAAMLLAMTQFRSSLNRDNEAFDGDLQVLMGLVGEDNPELAASLERLAPHADGGVLTPSGLTNEFKTIAGDAVVSSLKGEDVSVTDKAKARMNELFVVEKDGEVISGTETQAKVANAENMLEQGNIQEAMSIVQSIDGPAGAQLSGWLRKAQTTLMAQDIQKMLGQNINLQAFGQAGAAAGSAADITNAIQGAVTGQSRLIQNEETGINILRRNTLPDVPGMPKSANPYKN